MTKISLSIVNSKCLPNLKIAIIFSLLRLGLTVSPTYCLDASENCGIPFVFSSDIKNVLK